MTIALEIVSWTVVGVVGALLGVLLAGRLQRLYPLGQHHLMTGPRIVGLGVLILSLFLPRPPIPSGEVLEAVGVALGMGVMAGDVLSFHLLRVAGWINPKLGEWAFKQFRPLLQSLGEASVAWSVAMEHEQWSRCPQLRQWVLEEIEVSVLLHIARKKENTLQLQELFCALIHEGREKEAETVFKLGAEQIRDGIGPEMGAKLVLAASPKLRQVGIRALGDTS